MSCPARLAPVLLASLLGSACSAVTPSSPNPSEGSMPTRRILVNGVRVVVQEFHASDVVAVQLWVGVGARDEASSELGLAHYLEHMLFKGTVTRAPGFVEREVEVVVGPIIASEVLAAAERALGRLPRSGLKRLPLSAPDAGRSARLEIERPGTQAYLGMAWLGPKLDHADTPVVDLLVSILGQSRSSRLPQMLRERLGLVSSVSTAYSALEAAGAVTVTAQLEPANLARAEAQILRELQRVRERGVTDAELRRAVTAAEARYAFSTEPAEGRADAFGRAETVWRLEEELAYVDHLRSVTPAQIRSAARRYLDPERYARLAFVPPAR